MSAIRRLLEAKERGPLTDEERARVRAMVSWAMTCGGGLGAGESPTEALAALLEHPETPESSLLRITIHERATIEDGRIVWWEVQWDERYDRNETPPPGEPTGAQTTSRRRTDAG